MAPELLMGERHGPPVDLWALGCVTFELLTGYPPFTGDSVEEVFGYAATAAHCLFVPAHRPAHTPSPRRRPPLCANLSATLHTSLSPSHVLDHLRGDAIRWPEEVGHFSPPAESFVRSLLVPAADERLGSSGFSEMQATAVTSPPSHARSGLSDM